MKYWGSVWLVMGVLTVSCGDDEGTSAGSPGQGGTLSDAAADTKATGGQAGAGGHAGQAGSAGSSLGGASGTAHGGEGGAAGSSATTIQFPSMALGTQGRGFVRLDNGGAVQLQMAVSCCGGGYGWPLVNHDWIDFVQGYSVNWVHVRTGPWRTVTGGEEDWASTGGAYLEVGGKADLSQWNPAFWDALEELIQYAGNRGIYVEVDVADGWGMKHAQADDLGPQWPYHPWSQWNNTQDEDWIGGAGAETIPAGSVWDHWVRKVASHTCKYGNVTIEDGNEISLKQGYTTAWSRSLVQIYRDQCAQQGYVVSDAPFQPVAGTNAESADTIGASEIDYAQWHTNDPVDPSGCAGKPCGVNEYNPDPPLTAQEMVDRVCTARSQQTWFAYWRHGQDEATMNESLSRMEQGCP